MTIPTDTIPGPTPTAASRTRHLLGEYGVVLALVCLIIVISLLQPSFLALGNLMNVMSQWAPVAIMGIGMTYVMLTGGFDLSMASTYALGAVLAAAFGQTAPPLLAFAGAILITALVGTVNGLIVTELRVNPFIATLGSSLIIAGITLLLTGNKPIQVSFDPFTVLGRGELLGVPFSALLMVALFVLAGLILAYTRYGHNVYAAGGNREAARLSGIRTDWVIASTYTIAGVTAGIAGSITASKLSSAQAGLSGSLVFDVLTVVIVGGTALTGGKGSIWRTAVGVGILATLQNGFNLLDIDPYYQNIIKGVIIIAALASFDWSRFSRIRRPGAD
ncbi:ABC transporter permease [Leucobacter weissii]|uniref:ABC transporter permease n=1 Tax=Leucobacter weissii TaxID=1983706 RepID=A0A939SAU6_9MICO|nr:ABC transporter permease [Leucobacter weissii]